MVFEQLFASYSLPQMIHGLRNQIWKKNNNNEKTTEKIFVPGSDLLSGEDSDLRHKSADLYVETTGQVSSKLNSYVLT